MSTTLWTLLLACSGDRVELPGSAPDEPDADVTDAYAQVAVSPAGVAWVSWVEVSAGQTIGTYVARSDAPHEPLSAPTRVETAEPPVVGSTEKPSLAASADRVALGYAGRGTLRHGDAKVAWVQTASADGAWGEPLQIDELSAEDRVVEQVRVAFSADGELWATWKRQIYGLEDHPHWAREGDGFVPVEVSPELSDGHDCSPPDFRFGPTNRPLLALRSNIDGMLQTVIVAGVGAAPVQVSDDTWPYNPDVCPTDGPRVAERGDGELTLAWLAPTDDVWRLHTATTDGGVFGPPGVTPGDVGLGERWVSLAADGDRVWTAVEAVDHTTQVFATDEAARDLLSPAGEPLSGVELAAGGGRVVALGRTDAGELVLVDLP